MFVGSNRAVMFRGVNRMPRRAVRPSGTDEHLGWARRRSSM